MMPIVFLSFVALACCLERGWYWFGYYLHARGRNNILEKVFASPWDCNRALQACVTTSDPVVLTLREFLVQYQNVALEIAERKSRLVAEHQFLESRRSLDLLGLIASISGTLGLMGTVVGISISFKSLAMQDSKMMSLSLATALYTTVAGIILFLPTYLCWFFLQKFSERLENDLEVNIQKMKDILEIQQNSRMVFADDRPQILDPGIPARQLVFAGEAEEGHQVLKDFSASAEGSPPVREKTSLDVEDDEEED